MSKTVKELANDLGLSRNGLEMRILRIPNFREKYTKRDRHHRIRIDEQGCRVLSSYHGNTTSVVTNHDSYKIKLLSQRVDLMNKQLKSSKIMINDLNHNFSDLESFMKRQQKLLDHQQQLQLQTEKENHELTKKLRGPLENSSNDSGNHTGQGEKPQKHGFWSKIFGR